MKKIGWIFVVIMIVFIFSPLWWGSVFGQVPILPIGMGEEKNNTGISSTAIGFTALGGVFLGKPEVHDSNVVTCTVNHNGEPCSWEEDASRRILRDAMFPNERGKNLNSITIPLFIPDDYISKADVFKYAEECYSDSVGWYITTIDTILYVGDIFFTLYKTEIIMIPKTPTFEGFIEWLKK